MSLLVDRPDATVTISRFDQGEEGPGPHLHREHADCFLVLSGSLRFGVAGEWLDVGPGETLVAPPGLVHTFLNERPEESWWVNVHAPAAGFAEMLRARRDGREPDPWDSYDAEPTDGIPFSEAAVGPAVATSWLRVDPLDLAAGDEAERELEGLAVVLVRAGSARLRAVGIDAWVERYGMAALPPGTRWSIAAEEATQLLVAEIPQR